MTHPSFQGRPAIHTYDNVKVLERQVINPLKRITVVSQDGFAEAQAYGPGKGE